MCEVEVRWSQSLGLVREESSGCWRLGARCWVYGAGGLRDREVSVGVGFSHRR